MDISDADGPGNSGPFHFALSGEGAERFEIGPEGNLRTATVLHFADAGVYLLTVKDPHFCLLGSVEKVCSLFSGYRLRFWRTESLHRVSVDCARNGRE